MNTPKVSLNKKSSIGSTRNWSSQQPFGAMCSTFPQLTVAAPSADSTYQLISSYSSSSTSLGLSFASSQAPLSPLSTPEPPLLTTSATHVQPTNRQAKKRKPYKRTFGSTAQDSKPKTPI